MRWGVAQLEHEVDTYKADSSAQQKSISELEQQKRQLADDLQVHPLPSHTLPSQLSLPIPRVMIAAFCAATHNRPYRHVASFSVLRLHLLHGARLDFFAFISRE